MSIPEDDPIQPKTCPECCKNDRAEVPAPPPANLRTHLRAAPDPREVSA